MHDVSELLLWLVEFGAFQALEPGGHLSSAMRRHREVREQKHCTSPAACCPLAVKGAQTPTRAVKICT